MEAADARVARVCRVLEDGRASRADVCSACVAVARLAADARVMREEVVVLVKLLKDVAGKFAEDAELVGKAAVSLACLAEKKSLVSEVVSEGCVQILVEAWRRFDDCETLVVDALVALRSMCTSEDAREAVRVCGVCSMVVTAMRRFKMSEGVHGNGLSLLVNLSFGDSEARAEVSGCGAVSSVVDTLERFTRPSAGRLHVKGCTVLRNLFAGCQEGETVPGTKRAILCVVTSLACYGRVEDVSEQGLSALINAARGDCSVFKEEEVHSRLLEVVTVLARRTNADSHGRTQELLITLFATLGRDSQTLREALEKFECTKLCIAIGEAHLIRLQLVQVSSQSRSRSVLRRCAALCRIAGFCEESRRTLAGSEKGVWFLVECLRRLRGEAIPVEQALLATGNMLFDSAEAKESFAALDGCSAILGAMNAYPHVSAVQEASLLAFRAVCDGSMENSTRCLDLRIHRVCVSVMRTFGENPLIQEQALACVIAIGQSVPTYPDWDSSPLSKAAGRATEAFPTSVTLRAQNEVLLGILGMPNDGSKMRGSKPVRHRRPKWHGHQDS